MKSKLSVTDNGGPSNKIYKLSEIAALFDVCLGTVRQWVRHGKLRFFLTPGGHMRFLQQDLDVFILQYCQTAAAGTTPCRVVACHSIAGPGPVKAVPASAQAASNGLSSLLAQNHRALNEKAKTWAALSAGHNDPVRSWEKTPNGKVRH